MGELSFFVCWKMIFERFFGCRSRKEEIQALSGPNEFPEFYSRLKNIRQYYPRNPSEEVRSKHSIWSFDDFTCLSDCCTNVYGIRTIYETITGNRRWRTIRYEDNQKKIIDFICFSLNSISKFYWWRRLWTFSWFTSSLWKLFEYQRNRSKTYFLFEFFNYSYLIENRLYHIYTTIWSFIWNS